jgi:gentisate 1,2-dioxygenase
MFLRTGCVLPDGLDLKQEEFCGTWKTVENIMPSALDAKVRNAGWHFMCLEDAYSRSGMGLTATSAIDKAITHALNQVKSRFNAAELASISVSKYPGFQIAKIKLHARHIQQQASLSLVDEMTIRQLAGR